MKYCGSTAMRHVDFEGGTKRKTGVWVQKRLKRKEKDGKEIARKNKWTNVFYDEIRMDVKKLGLGCAKLSPSHSTQNKVI